MSEVVGGRRERSGGGRAGALARMSPAVFLAALAGGLGAVAARDALRATPGGRGVARPRRRAAQPCGQRGLRAERGRAEAPGARDRRGAPGRRHVAARARARGSACRRRPGGRKLGRRCAGQAIPRARLSARFLASRSRPPMRSRRGARCARRSTPPPARSKAPPRPRWPASAPTSTWAFRWSPRWAASARAFAPPGSTRSAPRSSRRGSREATWWASFAATRPRRPLARESRPTRARRPRRPGSPGSSWRRCPPARRSLPSFSIRDSSPASFRTASRWPSSRWRRVPGCRLRRDLAARASGSVSPGLAALAGLFVFAAAWELMGMRGSTARRTSGALAANRLDALRDTLAVRLDVERRLVRAGVAERITPRRFIGAKLAGAGWGVAALAVVRRARPPGSDPRGGPRRLRLRRPRRLGRAPRAPPPHRRWLPRSPMHSTWSRSAPRPAARRSPSLKRSRRERRAPCGGAGPGRSRDRGRRPPVRCSGRASRAHRRA